MTDESRNAMPEQNDGGLKPGQRAILRNGHPWSPAACTLIAWEQYGPGHGLRWWGWRVKLDEPAGQEAYASVDELGIPRVDSIKVYRGKKR